MNVMFLDYDGVVNTPMWSDKGVEGHFPSFNFPSDGKVNNFQAVQWINHFCLTRDYKIVVTSTWRMDWNYEQCLRQGGLSDDVSVLGCTDVDHCEDRALLIKLWLRQHHEDIEHIVIIDDDRFNYKEEGLEKFFVQTNPAAGFLMGEFYKANQVDELPTWEFQLLMKGVMEDERLQRSV